MRNIQDFYDEMKSGFNKNLLFLIPTRGESFAERAGGNLWKLFFPEDKSFKIIRENETSETSFIFNLPITASCLRFTKTVEEIYLFRKSSEVMVYLNKYNYIIPLLFDAHDIIEKFFPDSELILEVVSYPEEENSEQLTLSIKTSLIPTEAISKLDQFDEEWWIDVLYQLKGKLSINLEFE